jgi:hypothetical protein
VFTGVSTLAAAASVVFAIYSYRRQRDKEAFSGFRLTLLELRDLVAKTDAHLSSAYFAELGHKIARRIASLLPDNVTKDQLIQYLSDKSKHDFVAQAIYLGRHDSSTIDRLNDFAQQLNRLPYRYREQFPIVFELTRRLLFYVRAIARKVAAPKLLDMAIGNPDTVTGAIEEKALFDCESVQDCLVDLENYMSAAPSTIIQLQQPVFDDAEKLLCILIDKFSNMTDESLRLQSKAQRQMLDDIARIDEPTSIETAFALFNMIRALFSHAEWDSIVEAKTRLQGKAHPQDNDD